MTILSSLSPTLQFSPSLPPRFSPGQLRPTRFPPFSGRLRRPPSLTATANPPAPEEEDIKVIAAMESRYNKIVILDGPDSRVLLLDPTHNVHSVVNKGEELWTQSYWDEFVTLPAIIPGGDTVAMFGLGGGTAAKLMLEVWPELRIQGWEIDDVLIYKARQHLGLEDLERGTGSGGFLEVCIGDALSPASTVTGGYAGIVVDLFGNGKVLPELEDPKTWVEMKEKLMPGGRIMANCGGISSENERVAAAGRLGWELNDVIKAMKEAFPAGELHWKKIPANVEEMERAGHINFMAVTGALPEFSGWVGALPPPHREYLRSSVHQWRTC